MIKEADFAFRQALAFCPYSPEAVFPLRQPAAFTLKSNALMMLWSSLKPA
jgi:hypothetical protein